LWSFRYFKKSKDYPHEGTKDTKFYFFVSFVPSW
jgi:hypothetical protein